MLPIETSEKFKPQGLLNQVDFSELLNNLGEVASTLDSYPDGLITLTDWKVPEPDQIENQQQES
jgi:hypothetical protein